MNINYTTTEQSDRLINAGIPVSSADCYFYTKVDKQPKVLAIDGFDWSESPYIPCWSVGRLIEIYLLCCRETETFNSHIIFNKQFYKGAESLVKLIYEDIEYLDFSKLADYERD